MKQEQLTKLLSLYKQAIDKKLTASDFAKEILAAKIEIDSSFVKEGKEDTNLGEYLNELQELQNKIQNEQS